MSKIKRHWKINTFGIQQHTEQFTAQTALVGKQQELIASQQNNVSNVVASNKKIVANLSQQAKDLTKIQGALQALEATLTKTLSALTSVQVRNGDLKKSVREVQQSLIEIGATSEVLQESFASLSAMDDLTSAATQQNGDLSRRKSKALVE